MRMSLFHPPPRMYATRVAPPSPPSVRQRRGHSAKGRGAWLTTAPTLVNGLVLRAQCDSSGSWCIFSGRVPLSRTLLDATLRPRAEVHFPQWPHQCRCHYRPSTLHVYCRHMCIPCGVVRAWCAPTPPYTHFMCNMYERAAALERWLGAGGGQAAGHCLGARLWVLAYSASGAGVRVWGWCVSSWAARVLGLFSVQGACAHSEPRRCADASLIRSVSFAEPSAPLHDLRWLALLCWAACAVESVTSGNACEVQSRPRVRISRL